MCKLFTSTDICIIPYLQLAFEKYMTDNISVPWNIQFQIHNDCYEELFKQVYIIH